MLMGKQLHKGEPWASLLFSACAASPPPHPCHSVKYVSCLPQLIDSPQKWKLILGRSNVKPPEEELNISEENMVKNGNCYFRFFENLSRRAKNRKQLVCGTMDLSSLS